MFSNSISRRTESEILVVYRCKLKFRPNLREALKDKGEQFSGGKDITIPQTEMFL